LSSILLDNVYYIHTKYLLKKILNVKIKAKKIL